MKDLKVITFSKKGYDDFIDFIKAYAILCVLFGHTFLWLDKVAYAAWAGMQVPLFILVQVFHGYKKEKVIFSFRKLFKRVLLPFFIVEFITFVLALIIRGYECNALVVNMINGGGCGPGSYYPWIYLQVALLIPMFGLMLNKCNRWISLFVFLFICEGTEVLLSLVDISEMAYRLLAVRYLFLLFLGWLWVKDGVRVNGVTILLSVISLITIIYFEYFSVNDEPWFFSTKWKTHRWPCYFFVANGLVALLSVVWEKMKGNRYIKFAVEKLASSSYEIFLVQMMTIYLFKWSDLTIIPSMPIRYGVWVIVVWGISVLGGIFIKKAFARFA